MLVSPSYCRFSIKAWSPHTKLAQLPEPQLLNAPLCSLWVIGHGEPGPGALKKSSFVLICFFKTESTHAVPWHILVSGSFARDPSHYFANARESGGNLETPSNADDHAWREMGPHGANGICPQSLHPNGFLSRLWLSLGDRCPWNPKIRSPLQMNPQPFGIRVKEREARNLQRVFVFLRVPASPFDSTSTVCRETEPSAAPHPSLPKTNRRCEMLRLHTRPRGPSPLTPRAPTAPLPSAGVDTSPLSLPSRVFKPSPRRF